MPGPANSKRKKKGNNKKQQQQKKQGVNDPKPPILAGKLSPEPQKPPIPPSSPAPPTPSPPPISQNPETHLTAARSESYEDSSDPPSPLLTPPPFHFVFGLEYDYVQTSPPKERIVPEEYIEVIEKALNKPPFIHDPGNGPRVRDTREFLKSEFFAQPPAVDDPLCAEFAQPEVLQMLQTVLPEETAMILWYNKSRATGRICPACQRLYRLGDILPEHDVGEEGERQTRPPPPQLRLEQEISGFCSPVCFVLASFTFPGAIKGAWGKMAEEIDDIAWELLNSPNTRPLRGQSETSHTLGLIVRMTRLHDLGLGQLCFSPEEAEELASRGAEEDPPLS